MKTILIVDDEPEQLRSLRVGLENKGYHIITTLDTLEALCILDNPHRHVDLVITDFLMPGTNGMDFLKKIKEKYPSLPVIMMTAYGEKEVVIEALRNRCDSFIEKPFTLDELLCEVRKAENRPDSKADKNDLAHKLPRIVHQINNPLLCIFGYAELGIEQSASPDATKEFFESIMDAAKDIHAINEDILMLSVPGKGRIERINLIQVIEKSLKAFNGIMTQKEILVKKEFESENIYLNGSGDDLEQAVRNLIMNAIDSMDGKSRKILKVSVDISVENSGVLLCIEDTGCGISEDNIGRIFDPYFTRKKNGNGIGLAVVKEAVSKHQGSIRVESRVDMGSSFIIELPVAKTVIWEN